MQCFQCFTLEVTDDFSNIISNKYKDKVKTARREPPWGGLSSRMASVCYDEGEQSRPERVFYFTARETLVCSPYTRQP